MPNHDQITISVALVLIVCLPVFTVAIAAGQTQAFMGDVVTLSGYSYTGNTVYLFLTGPNLAQNGVALDNIYRPADQGGATQVQVEGDGHWVYKWNTGGAGGRLDAGAYTVWVADGPSDLSHLSAVDYNTINVILSVPSVSAGTSGTPDLSPGPAPAGSMELQSVPGGSSVVINNAFKGTTPLTVDGLDPGTYTVTFSHFGYAALTTPVSVQAGIISQVNVTLVPATGSLMVNTTPPGALLVIDSMPGVLSPASIPAVPPGNHSLSVTKEGFVPKILPVRITAGQTARIDLALEPQAAPGPTGTQKAGLLPVTSVAGLIVAVLMASKHWRQ